MNPGPSKATEAIVAVLLPPACREEVLGDLYERYRSPYQYGLDALRTIPMVVFSSVRRTADPQVLLLQAFALYGSFLGAAWLKGGGGLLRLAHPAGIAMLGLLLEGAYSKPGGRSLLRLIRGPLVGLGLALMSQAVFRSVPAWTMLYGCAMGLLLTSAVRNLFPPVSEQLQGANVPAQGLAAIVSLSIIQVVETRFMKIAICSVAMICLVALWWITTGSRPGLDKLTYSQFLEQVRAGRVTSVTVIDNRSGAAQATGHLRDGKTVRTVLPMDYQDALAAMQDKLVNIEIQGGPSFINAAPFLVLLGVWVIALLFKFRCGANSHVGKPAV